MGTLTYLYKADSNESYHLGKGEWFQICRSDDFVIFRLPELWTVDTLAMFVRRAVSTEGGISIEDARLTAEDIFRWAGNDRIVQIPDTFDYRDELKSLGLDIKGRRYRRESNRWKPISGTPMNAEEKEQNDLLSFENRQSYMAVMWSGMKKMRELNLTSASG
jgi:hypothetical protein